VADGISRLAVAWREEYLRGWIRTWVVEGEDKGWATLGVPGKSRVVDEVGGIIFVILRRWLCARKQGAGAPTCHKRAHQVVMGLIPQVGGRSCKAARSLLL
jgi:hypothetical protein